MREFESDDPVCSDPLRTPSSNDVIIEIASNNSNNNNDDGTDDMEAFLRDIPKIELHVHLDGSFDPHQIWKHLVDNPHLLHCLPVEKKFPWLEDADPPKPLRSMVASCKTEMEFSTLCICRREPAHIANTKQTGTAAAANIGDGRSLGRMLECFEIFLPLVQDNFDLLEVLAFDFVRRQEEQNVIYTEVRYSPHLFSSTDPRRAHTAITRGLRKGCALHKITVNQILCAINFRPEWSMEVVEMAHELSNDFPCAVVGVDVAAGEDHFQENSHAHQGHYDMCQRAKELGLNITIHAGETPGSAENVCKAIENYGAVRIGHGYRVLDVPEFVDRVKVANPDVHFEVCPTSSVETGAWDQTVWKDHPACKLQELGFRMSISSDDPAVFDTSLTSQLGIVLKEMGWERQEILQSLEDAIAASFTSDEEKARLRQRIFIDTEAIQAS